MSLAPYSSLVAPPSALGRDANRGEARLSSHSGLLGQQHAKLDGSFHSETGGNNSGTSTCLQHHHVDLTPKERLKRQRRGGFRRTVDLGSIGQHGKGRAVWSDGLRRQGATVANYAWPQLANTAHTLPKPREVAGWPRLVQSRGSAKSGVNHGSESGRINSIHCFNDTVAEIDSEFNPRQALRRAPRSTNVAEARRSYKRMLKPPKAIHNVTKHYRRLAMKREFNHLIESQLGHQAPLWREFEASANVCPIQGYHRSRVGTPARNIMRVAIGGRAWARVKDENQRKASMIESELTGPSADGLMPPGQMEGWSDI